MMIRVLYNEFVSIRCYVDDGRLFWNATDILPLIHTSSKRTWDILSVFFDEHHVFRKIKDLESLGSSQEGYVLSSEEMLHLAENNPKNNQLLAWVYSILTQPLVRVVPNQPVYRLLYPGEKFPFITLFNLGVRYIPPHPGMTDSSTYPKQYASAYCQTDPRQEKVVETQTDPLVVSLNVTKVITF